MSRNSEKCVISVDFDGTVVLAGVHPEVGAEITGAADTLKECVDLGAKLILNTCRHGEALYAAINWFDERKIELWQVNRNPHFPDAKGKTYAHIYVEDRGLGIPLKRLTGILPFVDWEKARPMLLSAVATRILEWELRQ